MRKFHDTIMEVNVTLSIEDTILVEVDESLNVVLEENSYPASQWTPPEYELELCDEEKIVDDIINNTKFESKYNSLKAVMREILEELIEKAEINDPYAPIIINEEIDLAEWLNR